MRPRLSSRQKRLDDAHNRGVRLHIWSQKELENYFLLVNPIVRAIIRRMPARTAKPSAEEIETALDEICERLKEDVFDAISAEILGENRALGSGGANKRAREIVAERWQSREARLATVSGKEAFARLSEWSQHQFGVSLSAAIIAREMSGSEVQEEMCKVITAIEYGTEINSHRDSAK